VRRRHINTSTILTDRNKLPGASASVVFTQAFEIAVVHYEAMRRCDVSRRGGAAFHPPQAGGGRRASPGQKCGGRNDRRNGLKSPWVWRMVNNYTTQPFARSAVSCAHAERTHGGIIVEKPWRYSRRGDRCMPGSGADLTPGRRAVPAPDVGGRRASTN
jgi:hypothetical protein